MEDRNPVTKAEVKGENISPDCYLEALFDRGDKRFRMSRGELMEFNRCPHRWRAGYKEASNGSMDWGSLVDCLLLQPEQFAQRYAVTPATYRSEKGEEKPWNWNAKVCQQWRDDLGNSEPLKPGEYAEAQQACAVLMADEQIREMVQASRKQVMVIGEYRDEATSLVIPLKCLIDLVPPVSVKSLADLKTANSAAQFPWKRAVFDHHYHVQAAMELDLYTAATGEDRVGFLHIVQESFAPWEIGKRMLSEEFIRLGRAQYIAALKRYARCLAEDVWPGYEDGQRNCIDGWTLTEPDAWMITP